MFEFLVYTTALLLCAVGNLAADSSSMEVKHAAMGFSAVTGLGLALLMMGAACGLFGDWSSGRPFFVIGGMLLTLSAACIVSVGVYRLISALGFGGDDG